MINQIPLPPDDDSLPFVWKERIFQIIKFLNNRVFNGNTEFGSMTWTPLAGRPSDRTAGQVAMIYTTGGSADARTATPKLMIADGTDWRLVEDYSIWTG